MESMQWPTVFPAALQRAGLAAAAQEAKVPAALSIHFGPGVVIHRRRPRKFRDEARPVAAAAAAQKTLGVVLKQVADHLLDVVVPFQAD